MSTEELEIKKFELEKLKLVYDQVAEHHRYFLSWRQLLIAGYFAMVGVILYAAYTLFDKGGDYAKLTFLITLCIPFLSRFFLLLDRRNMDLYHVCQRVGSKIEQILFDKFDEKSKDNSGLFFTLDKSHENSTHSTHSRLIEILFKSIMILSSILTIYLFLLKTIG